MSSKCHIILCPFIREALYRYFSAGNPMPLQAYLGYGTVVQLEETFLIVGGFHYGEYLDTIYRYEKDSDSWTRLEAILPGVVAAPIAMMVDIDIFPAHRLRCVPLRTADQLLVWAYLAAPPIPWCPSGRGKLSHYC